jgi:hypothetical protein
VSSDRTLASMAYLLRPRTLRVDRQNGTLSWSLPLHYWNALALAMLAAFFVLIGATDLDLGPSDARLGLAAGERLGPLGQVVGYWAPDLWPAEVLPSFLLAQLEPGGRPSSAAVRWPAALAGILAGILLSRRMMNVMGRRACLLMGVCWFSSIALIDRSGAIELDLILGLATLAALDRLMTAGTGWVAGTWAALAFLSGGLPPLIVIALAIVVMGRKQALPSLALIIPPLAAVIVWTAWTSKTVSPELCASALALPFTQKPAWLLGLGAFALGLPFSPFAALALFRSARADQAPEARSWLIGWFQVAVASLIAGSVVPGLANPARVIVLAAIAIGAASGLDAIGKPTVSRQAIRTFFVLFSLVIGGWLCIMMYGSYIWNLCLAYYRVLGISMSILIIVVAGLCWLALANRKIGIAMATLVLIAVGLKVVYWGYYVPEWNYRYSQGPWARAIAQWVPRKWTLYTIHDWPPDLAFFTKRSVRQLYGPHYLEYQPGNSSKFVLLLPAEFENWPTSAPPITLVAKFQDASASERILARTPGRLPLPPGRDPAWLSLIRKHSGTTSQEQQAR